VLSTTEEKVTPQLSAANTGLKIARLVFSILAGLLLILTLFAFVRAGFFYSLYPWLLARVVTKTGLDLWQSRAITLGCLALLWFFPWHILVIPWIKDAKLRFALWTTVTMLALTGMHLITRDVYFSRADGQPQKYYIKVLEGFKLADAPGVDPIWGIPYQPITKEVAKEYILWKIRTMEQAPPIPEGLYFSPSTGEPLAWYAKTPEGAIEVFSLPGFHPTYGTKLLPVTADIIAAYEKGKAEQARQRQEKLAGEQRKEKEETERRAKAEAIRKARAEADRQAKEEARMKEPLQPGRYLFQDPRPSSTVDGLKLTLSEVDLRQEAMLVHLEIENVGVDPTQEPRFRTPNPTQHYRFRMLTREGACQKYSAMQIKEGALTKENGTVTFPPTGKRVMEFPRQENPASFSITVNDQPIFSAINLHNLGFQSF
jgi:hypothetical protein